MHIHSGSFVVLLCRKVVLVDLSSSQWQKTRRGHFGRFYCTRRRVHVNGSFHVWLCKHIIEKAETLERRPAYTFLHKLIVVRASTLKCIVEVPNLRQCKLSCTIHELCCSHLHCDKLCKKESTVHVRSTCAFKCQQQFQSLTDHCFKIYNDREQP